VRLERAEDVEPQAPAALCKVRGTGFGVEAAVIHATVAEDCKHKSQELGIEHQVFDIKRQKLLERRNFDGLFVGVD
jgi:hypothetical protein